MLSSRTCFPRQSGMVLARIIWILLAWALLIVSAAAAEERSALAGQRFPLSVYETAVDAGKAWAAQQAALKKYPKDQWGSCRIQNTRLVCGPKPASPPAPPYPAAPPEDASLGGAGRYVYGWAPISAVQNGVHLVAEWRRLADTGSIFDCGEWSCASIVWVTPDVVRPDRAERLAACRVSKLRGNVVGAPQDCSGLVIFESKDTWVRIALGQRVPTAASPAFGRSAHLHVFRAARPTPDEAFVKIREILEGPPLVLSSDVGPNRSIVGSAFYRTSPLLLGWREMVTVRVDIETAQQPPPPWLGLTVSVNLYVTPQNTPRPEDWHLPTPQQADTWREHLSSALRSSMAVFCRAPIWQRNNVLLCDLPAGTQIPDWVR